MPSTLTSMFSYVKTASITMVTDGPISQIQTVPTAATTNLDMDPHNATMASITMVTSSSILKIQIAIPLSMKLKMSTLMIVPMVLMMMAMDGLMEMMSIVSPLEQNLEIPALPVTMTMIMILMGLSMVKIQSASQAGTIQKTVHRQAVKMASMMTKMDGLIMVIQIVRSMV